MDAQQKPEMAQSKITTVLRTSRVSFRIDYLTYVQYQPYPQADRDLRVFQRKPRKRHVIR